MIKINAKIALRNFLVKRKLLTKAGNLHKYLHLILEGDPFGRMRKSGEAPMPKTLIYEPTMRCNFNCSMCYLKTRDIARSGELDTLQIEGIINNLPHEIEHYSITGGEPTMRKDLTQILLFLKRKKRSSVCLMTNGSCPERLKELLSAGLVAAVQLSLDGPREVHNAIRNSSKSYDLFMESLNELKQHRNVYAYILTVICKENLKHLAEITRFCSGQGITNLTFEFEKKYDKGCIADSIRELEPLMHLTREDFFISESASAFPEFSIRELKDALISAEHESKKVYFQNQYLPYSLFKNLEHYYLRNLRKSYKLQCRHLLTARIDPLGNVIACFGVRKPFGNLLREPLEKIWNNEDFRRYRKFMLGNNLLPICETCHRAESFDTGFGRIS